MDYSNLFVVLMGLGPVFAGLLCIILLVTLMSWVCNRTAAPSAVTPSKTGMFLIVIAIILFFAKIQLCCYTAK